MPGSSTRLRRAAITVAELLAVGASASLIAVVVLKLWRADLHIPLSYGGDGIFYSSLTKRITEAGWFQHNPRLGFPFGQQLYDFPQTSDLLHFVALRFIALFTSNYVLALNTFYLATYPVDAVIAYSVLRAMGRSRITAVFGCLLFAFLPYHVFRGESHVMLSAYEAVPLGALLLYWTFQPRPLLLGEGERRITLLWRDRRALVAVAIAVMLGMTGGYYAVFAGVPIAVAAVVGLVAGWDWRRSVSALALVGITAVSLGLALSPSLLYSMKHGVDSEARHRDPVATEYFGLKISQLVLPVPGHHIPLLAKIERKANNPVLPSETGQNLGIIGACGFAGLLLWSLRRVIRGDRLSPTDEAVTPLAFGTLVSVVFGVIGGFSLLLALGGLTEIRSWNRESLLISFYSLAAVGLVIDRAGLRPRIRRAPAALAVALLVVLGIGLWDETSPLAVPQYAAFDAEWARDGQMVRAVERRLPPGAAIFQLPVVAFPESPPVHNMFDYDHLRGYLHSNTLKWSYGEVKGRDGDWQQQIAHADAAHLVPTLVGVGFTAIWVDGAGYDDNGQGLADQLAPLSGPAVATSSDGRFRLYDLRPAKPRVLAALGDARLKAAALAATHPIEVKINGSHVTLLNTLPGTRSVTITVLGEPPVHEQLRAGTTPFAPASGRRVQPGEVTVVDDAVASAVVS